MRFLSSFLCLLAGACAILWISILGWSLPGGNGGQSGVLMLSYFLLGVAQIFLLGWLVLVPHWTWPGYAITYCGFLELALFPVVIFFLVGRFAITSLASWEFLLLSTFPLLSILAGWVGSRRPRQKPLGLWAYDLSHWQRTDRSERVERQGEP
jgi:hypothetical protein